MELFNKKKASNKILDIIPAAKIQEDLERYKRMALELGADTAEVIPTNVISIDERVRAKCQIPNCIYFGTNLNCPPYAPDINFMRKFVSKYRYGVLFSVKGNTMDFIGKNRKRGVHENPARLLLFQICAEIESTAFYDGYHLTIALGTGPCKSFWCTNEPCSGIQPGAGCRFPLKARISLEACGMDVFKLVSHYGWSIYPCGERVDPEKLPHIRLVGLALVC
jgi:predicted metal-binding protein